MQGYHAKLMIESTAYFLLKLTQLYSANTLMKMTQNLLSAVCTFGNGMPFACISNSLNKPTPLQLDVSLPSLQDIKWSFSRLIYLFNIQLERNVAT